jgi:hypothetical protein
MIPGPEGRTLIYDAFVREGVCYLTSTYWHYREPPMVIEIDGVRAEEIGHNEYEPVRYFRVPVTGVPTAVTINGIRFAFPVALDILPAPAGKGLAVATLFKHDHAYIGSMIEWYRTQGVTDFYLYFNGPVLPAGLPSGSGIHYGLWNHRYWNPTNWRDKETGWVHAAQTAFLTMARLRYLPDHEWVGFVDIDEHVWPSDGRRIRETLQDISAEVNVVFVSNHYAFRSHDCLIYTTVSEGGWAGRTKCFYRGTYRGLCGVHAPKGSDYVRFNYEDMPMLHVVNYGHKERMSKIHEPRVRVPWPRPKVEGVMAGVQQPTG